MSLRGRFQFHLSTAALGMIAIGVVMPKIISAFRHSAVDGAAVLYTVAIPFVLGALEFEAFLARRDDAAREPGAEKLPSPKLVIRFPIVVFVLELALIGIWAFAAARTYMLFLNAAI